MSAIWAVGCWTVKVVRGRILFAEVAIKFLAIPAPLLLHHLRQAMDDDVEKAAHHEPNQDDA